MKKNVVIIIDDEQLFLATPLSNITVYKLNCTRDHGEYLGFRGLGAVRNFKGVWDQSPRKFLDHAFYLEERPRMKTVLWYHL